MPYIRIFWVKFSSKAQFAGKQCVGWVCLKWMKTKWKPNQKWKPLVSENPTFWPVLAEVLMIQIQVQSCYRAAWVLPATVRCVSDICSLQERHWPVSARAGFFLQSNTWKLSSHHEFVYLQSNTLLFADPFYVPRGAVSADTASSCPFMWLHLDYLTRQKILWSLLASPGLVIDTSQEQILIKLKVHSSQV